MRREEKRSEEIGRERKRKEGKVKESSEVSRLMYVLTCSTVSLSVLSPPALAPAPALYPVQLLALDLKTCHRL